MVERAIELVSHFTTDVFLSVDLEALSSRGWVAVPVIMDRYSDEEAQRLVAAVHKHLGSPHLMAICETFTYSSEAPASSVWTVLPTEADLNKTEWELAPFYFLLTDEEPNFLIWCTKDDWHLLAGPSDFIEDVLGKPLAIARQDFVDFWNGDPGSYWHKVRKPILELAERLANI